MCFPWPLPRCTQHHLQPIAKLKIVYIMADSSRSSSVSTVHILLRDDRLFPQSPHLPPSLTMLSQICPQTPNDTLSFLISPLMSNSPDHCHYLFICSNAFTSLKFGLWSRRHLCRALAGKLRFALNVFSTDNINFFVQNSSSS